MRRDRVRDIIGDYVQDVDEGVLIDVVGDAMRWREVVNEGLEEEGDDRIFSNKAYTSKSSPSDTSNNSSSNRPTQTPSDNPVTYQYGIIKQKKTKITSSSLFPLSLVTTNIPTAEPSPICVTTEDGFVIIYSSKTCKIISSPPLNYQSTDDLIVTENR